MFLRAHHIDQITFLSPYMRHLSDVEFKKENSVNPFYMDNWTLMTFSHLLQFSQEFHIKQAEIRHQNVLNCITLYILKVAATKIKVFQAWMEPHVPTFCTYSPTSTMIPIPLISPPATKIKKTSLTHYQCPLFTI